MSDGPRAKVTGRYWHHQKEQTPEASDLGFQDRLVVRLAELTGVTLPLPKAKDR